MKKRLVLLMATGAMIATGLTATSAYAFDTTTPTAKEYDSAVKKDDKKDKLNAVVDVKITYGKDTSESHEIIKANGFNKDGKLNATFVTTDSDDTTENKTIELSYKDGCYDGNKKAKVSESDVKDSINATIFRSLSSEYLTELNVKEEKGNSKIYSFKASDEAIQKYVDKYLSSVGFTSVDSEDEEFSCTLKSLEGNVTTDKKGNITDRKITLNSEYTLGKDVTKVTQEYDIKYVTDKEVKALEKTSAKSTDANKKSDKAAKTSKKSNKADKTSLKKTSSTPKASAKKAKTSDKSVAVTESSGKLITTVNVNMRKGPSTNNAVISVIPQGTVIDQTGKTSTGWFRITFNRTTGFVSAQCVKAYQAPAKQPKSNTAKVNTSATNAQKPAQDNSKAQATPMQAGPATKSNGEAYTVEGTVTKVANGSLSIKTSFESLDFDTSDARIEKTDSIQVGDKVTVKYEIGGYIKYAISVTDKVSHTESTPPTGGFTQAPVTEAPTQDAQPTVTQPEAETPAPETPAPVEETAPVEEAPTEEVTEAPAEEASAPAEDTCSDISDGIE